MEITDIRIYLRNENKLKAFVTVTFDKVFVVHNMKVIQGQKGLLLCMPSRKDPDGKFRDVVHPITNEFRKQLEERVFAIYEDEIKELSQSLERAPTDEKSVQPAAAAGAQEPTAAAAGAQEPKP